MGEARDAALVVGPGPVTLSQGPVFQYIAARGCRRLRRLGYRVLVLEDNPATLMDLGAGEGELFMEPAAAEVVRRIVERCDATSIWFGLGGRRGWTLAMRMAGEGWYEESGIRAPDLDDRALWLCGDRSLLRETLESNAIANPRFKAVGSIREGRDAAESIGFPLVVRPHFSCGAWGAGLAYNLEDYPALLEDAMRESLTGEVLVEEALEGWRKYIVLMLRDGGGGTVVAGVLEQEDPLPAHEEDAVLVYPPRRCGTEAGYALMETARQVVSALDLVGLVEIKLAAAPSWEALFVMDVNPRPWRSMPLLETARAADLVAAHLELVTGKTRAREYVGLEEKRPEGAMVAIPRPSYRAQGGGEGYLALGCRSMGRGLYRGRDAAEAAAMALESISRARAAEEEQGTIRALEELVGAGRKRAAGDAEMREGSPAGGVPSYCTSWHAGRDLAGGLMLLASDHAGPGGGYEANVNCCLALRAWKDGGGSAALYTPDPGFALLAAEEADAVFLGAMEVEAVARAASVAGVKRMAAHFGGRAAMGLAAGLAAKGLEVWGIEALEGEDRLKSALEKARSAGIRTVDVRLSSGLEDGTALLEEAVYPLLATVEGAGARSTQRLIYSREDGMDFLRESGREVLWRALREEVQEVMVEAVASGEGHVIILWEQMDAPGMHSTDGLAVCPPRYLTSEQSRKALELAHKAIEAMGWRGNLYMRIHLGDGDARLWSLYPGPSANLPFLQRASSVPLAALGMAAFGGGIVEGGVTSGRRTAVRAPLIPYGIIADADILPSPQRRSTGAVMGMADDPAMALAKALWGQGLRPQPGGRALLSVANREKRRAVMLARELMAAGFVLVATRGTAHALEAAGIRLETVNKLREGRPNILDLIRNGQVGLVVNIPRGKHPHSDGFYIRAASVRHGTPCITNMEVALALARGLRQADPPAWEVRPLDEYGQPRHEVRGG